MYKITALLLALSATCYAGVAGPNYKCGVKPDKLFHCIGRPIIINEDMNKQCYQYADRCERHNCIFRVNGWYNGSSDEILYDKIGAFYDSIAAEHPQWKNAAKAARECFRPDLEPYGSYLNCPTYDITQCSMTQFFRNVQIWASEGPECDESRWYAQNCKFCPNDCFRKDIPEGSCKACDFN